MNHLDLFSGIGGFSLGLEKVGFKTIAFCERDEYCRLLLQKHWKGVKIYNDIKKLEGKDIEEKVDILTGGFPCQPYSVAGKQKGTNDDRYLWPEMFRVIKEVKPTFIIAENVRGLINIQDGMVFETVCSDLESEGFEIQTFIIPAAGVGAPHKRDRVWIVGYSKHNGSLTSKIKRRDNKINAGTQEGRTRPSNLREQVDPETMRLWRTPDAHCDRGASIREKNEDESRKENANQYERSSSTSKHDVADSKSKQSFSKCNREEQGESSKQNKSNLEEVVAGHCGKQTGSLNPMWVEWLMGYPAGHTDLKDWEMLSSQNRGRNRKGNMESNKEPKLRILSLGAGVQSSTMALMADAGEFGVKPDAAVFADTGWEPEPVIKHLEYLKVF
jgi:DNA-cytosine methyltransferase